MSHAVKSEDDEQPADQKRYVEGPGAEASTVQDPPPDAPPRGTKVRMRTGVYAGAVGTLVDYTVGGRAVVVLPTEQLVNTGDIEQA